MNDDQPTVPYGYCHCGCGQKTNIAACTSAEKGWVKGEPKKFVLGHTTLKHHVTDAERRSYRAAWDGTGIPYGFCLCGCGQRTKVSGSMRYGAVRGEHFRFVVGHNGSPRKPDRYRVEDCGYKTPCWVWQLACDKDGYGIEHHRGRKDRAHRVSWERANGRPVPRGLGVDHLCRNPSCINPAHLEPVPQIENARRGRVAKLTVHKARAIHAALDRGESPWLLAKEYGVTYPTIYAIATGKTWRRETL